MNRKKNIIVSTLAFLCLCVIFLILTIKGFKIYCPFRYITGFNCPGCGNTRAVLSILKLDFKGMLKYNLLFPFEIFYILRVYIICVINYLKGKRFSYNPTSSILDITFLISLVLWTVIRNVTPLY
jgi:hypothetical protein